MHIRLVAYRRCGRLSRYVRILLSIGHRSMIIHLTETGPSIQLLAFLYTVARIAAGHLSVSKNDLASMGVSDTKLRHVAPTNSENETFTCS